MGAAKNDERRKYARVGFTTGIDIVFDSGDQRSVLKARSKDLSQKGLFVGTEDTYPLDTPCTVNVHLSGGVDDISLEIQGRVVRQADTGIGIVFESMDVDVYAHLRNIVRYNSEQD